MQRADTIERLRRVYAILRDEGKFTSADAVCCAIAEIERHRAAIVGGNEGQWQPIETAPKDGTPLLVACADWPHSTELGKPVPIKVGGWHPTGRYWQIFGASWRPTHWRPLPDAPKCGVERGINPQAADNLEAHQ